MLYLATNDPSDADDTVWFDDIPTTLGETSAPVAAPLDPLSLRVIQIASQEAWRSASHITLWTRAWRWFSGYPEAPRPLANPALEMLRDFATSLLWADERSLDLERAITRKGHYSHAQLDMVRRLLLA